MSPIEHEWNFFRWRFACDPRLVASKHELCLRVQAVWNSLTQADIQNLFDSMPRLYIAVTVTAFIAARGECTKY